MLSLLLDFEELSALSGGDDEDIAAEKNTINEDKDKDKDTGKERQRQRMYTHKQKRKKKEQHYEYGSTD